MPKIKPNPRLRLVELVFRVQVEADADDYGAVQGIIAHVANKVDGQPARIELEDGRSVLVQVNEMHGYEKDYD